jgi:hypothetical protein
MGTPRGHAPSLRRSSSRHWNRASRRIEPAGREAFQAATHQIQTVRHRQVWTAALPRPLAGRAELLSTSPVDQEAEDSSLLSLAEWAQVWLDSSLIPILLLECLGATGRRLGPARVARCSMSVWARSSRRSQPRIRSAGTVACGAGQAGHARRRPVRRCYRRTSIAVRSQFRGHRQAGLRRTGAAPLPDPRNSQRAGRMLVAAWTSAVLR